MYNIIHYTLRQISGIDFKFGIRNTLLPSNLEARRMIWNQLQWIHIVGTRFSKNCFVLSVMMHYKMKSSVQLLMLYCLINFIQGTTPCT